MFYSFLTKLKFFVAVSTYCAEYSCLSKTKNSNKFVLYEKLIKWRQWDLLVAAKELTFAFHAVVRDFSFKNSDCISIFLFQNLSLQ